MNRKCYVGEREGVIIPVAQVKDTLFFLTHPSSESSIWSEKLYYPLWFRVLTNVCCRQKLASTDRYEA